MARTAEQIQRTKARLQRAIDFLTSELEDVEKELAQIEKPVTLDKAFFWDHVAPLLGGYEGLTGAIIKSRLESLGLKIPEDNFRVFLSRNKTRGNLFTSRGITGLARWHLTESAKERLPKREDANTCD